MCVGGTVSTLVLGFFAHFCTFIGSEIITFVGAVCFLAISAKKAGSASKRKIKDQIAAFVPRSSRLVLSVLPEGCT